MTDDIIQHFLHTQVRQLCVWGRNWTSQLKISHSKRYWWSTIQKIIFHEPLKWWFWINIVLWWNNCWNLPSLWRLENASGIGWMSNLLLPIVKNERFTSWLNLSEICPSNWLLSTSRRTNFFKLKSCSGISPFNSFRSLLKWT